MDRERLGKTVAEPGLQRRTRDSIHYKALSIIPGCGV